MRHGRRINGSTVAYGYDLANNETSITYPGGSKVTRDFDAAGRMDWIQDWKSNKTTFGYDANSNLTTSTFPSSTGETDTNTYDNADAVSSIAAKKGTTNLATFTYTRTGAQQVASSTTSGITEAAQSYGYNTLGQLTKSGPTSSPVNYGYDSVDRLTARNSTSTQAYDAGSQLCWSKAAVVASPTCSTVPSGATKYTYDSRGNRTVKTPSSGTATTYTYDEGNHLTAVSGAATYAYDGDGLRLSKTLTGKSATRMVWDHSSDLPNLLGDGANTYVYGPDGNLLEQISSAGTVTFLHHDQLGSARLITSTSGANVGSYNFDPYGTQTAKSGTATTPFGYAGQYTDAETGLDYMRARYYDPASGEFISADPLGSAGSGQNLYGYAGGDPVNFSDPSGLLFRGFNNSIYCKVAGPICAPFKGYENVKSLVTPVADWTSDLGAQWAFDSSNPWYQQAAGWAIGVPASLFGCENFDRTAVTLGTGGVAGPVYKSAEEVGIRAGARYLSHTGRGDQYKRYYELANFIWRAIRHKAGF